MAKADDEAAAGGKGSEAEKDYGDEFNAELGDDTAASDVDASSGDDNNERDNDDFESDESKSGDKGRDRVRADAPIPGKRAAEMIQKAQDKVRREMEAQLNELRREMQATAAGGRAQYTPLQQLEFGKQKIAELRDQYEEELLGGKKDEAKATRKILNDLEERVSDLKVTIASRASQTGAAEDVRYSAALTLIEDKYPELNPEHEDFDGAKESEVSDLVDGLVAKGTAKDVALKRAVKYVLGERKAKKDGDADDPAMARTLEARKRAAAAAAKQPADGSRAGRGDEPTDSKVDLLKKITPHTFKKYTELPESEKAKLRGDVAN